MLDRKYEPDCHLHIGYYEDNDDFEATAYKRVNEDMWDIYFDFEVYGLEIPIIYQNQFRENIGAIIFTIQVDDLNYEIGYMQFSNWLFNQELVKIIPNP